MQSVLNGYNGTVMAYGQTGTGKTYTLGRLGKDDASERGIMVRALEDIISSMSVTSDSVEVSYLQVQHFSLCCIRTCFFLSVYLNIFWYLLLKCYINSFLLLCVGLSKPQFWGALNLIGTFILFKSYSCKPKMLKHLGV